MRNESDKKLHEGLGISPPSTPTKRKREGDIRTPSKRPKPTVKQETHDGEPFSDASSSPISNSVKSEEEGKVQIAAFPTDETFYVPDDFFKNGYGQITPESSMVSSNVSSSYVGASHLG